MAPSRLDAHEVPTARRPPGEERLEPAPAAVAPMPAPALLGGRMLPDQVLRLQATAGNAAVARALLQRGPTAVAERSQLKSAARRVAALAGISADKAQEELAFYVENGFDEARIVRAASVISGLAGKSGAGLYAALRKMPAEDAEAYWAVAGLIQARHPELTTAIRLVRDLRERVWFDIAETVSRDVAAGRHFVESLGPTEVDELWGQIEKQPKLSPGARAELGEAIAAIHAKATKADLDATAKILARGTGIGAAEWREKLEISVSVGVKSGDLKRLAPEVLRLAKRKLGPPLFEELLQRSYADVETLAILAMDMGPGHARLRVACELVYKFLSGTWWAFAATYKEDPGAAEMLLDVVPPAKLDEAWTELARAGFDKPDERRLRTRVEGAMKRAGEGDSERAVSERRRGKETGAALEKRVDSVLEDSKFRRKDILANIDRGVGHVDATLGSLIEVAATYKKARDKVEEIIKRAESEAKLDQEKMDALLGIAIAVGVGVGLGVAIPLAHGATRGAAAVLDAVGEVYEQKAGAVVKGTGSKAPAPAAGSWERADPQLKQTEAYKRCAELYRELLGLTPQIEQVSAVGDVGSDLKADMRELASTGSHSRFVIPQLEQMVRRYEVAGPGLRDVASQVQDIQATLRAEAAQAAREAKRADQWRMEKQIWIHWLGSRTGEEAELAGKPPVKGVLRAFGLLADDGDDSSIGWGVGDWHSDDNSRTGAQKAAAYSKALSLAGSAGTLLEGQPREVNTLTPDPEHRNVSFGGKRMGFVGRAKVGTEVYGVLVTGPAKAKDEIVVTGVVGREDRALYPGGDDTGKLGIVLSARPKPRTAADAIASLSDDTRPESAI